MDALRRLAAFIPVTLSRHILRHGAMTAGEPHELYAATLFSDISGFTAMSEELATDGARGAEEVNRVLMLTFTAMVDVIHAMGGAIAHFHGDAMAIYFPDEDGNAAARALSCAWQMQELMLTRFQAVETHRPPDKDPLFPLTIKIGAGYGRCAEIVLGDEQMGFEFVLMGTAVEEAAEAEKHASAGQIIASRSFCQQMQAVEPNSPDFTDISDKEQCASVESASNKGAPLLDWTAYGAEALAGLEQIAPAFMPSSLHQRLRNSHDAQLAEHRPVTSIFVEFEYGASTSSASSASSAGSVLQAYYQHVHAIVNRFGAENGRLNRVLTGDKGNQLHIMFGAPIAPDAPDQAIRCALALQRERPAYISGQRIGLAAGKVFAGPVGASSRSEYTVVGDVVNLSARLTAICENGRVVTDAITAKRVHQSIEFSTAPPIHLKGKQGAMVPHYVQGDVATATQVQAYFSRWNKPLVGRGAETAVMLALMDEAWQGDGRLLSIIGATGAGKTRLLATGVQHWLGKGGEGLVGVCQQHLSDTPFAAWRTIWQDFFGLLPTMSANAQAQLVINRTRALLPDANDDDVGLWGDLLGLPIPQTAVLTTMTAESRQMRFFALARRCLQVAATTQPLLIVLEDIHWADQASLKLIDELAAHLTAWPLLIALLFRPTDDLQLDALTEATTITITDLTPQDARLLMQQLTGAETLPPLVEQHLGLRDRDGRDSPVNPLFLEESLNMLIAADVLRINGRVQVDEKMLANMPMPDSIYGLLLARLDRLQPARRELLQVASVIGREFALGALQGISREQDHDTLIDLLTGLSSVQMTQQIANDPEWIYLFQHALTHEVAYESLPFARRQILHMAIADWLEIQHADNLKPFYAALAYHYGYTTAHEKGLKYALAAANAARDIFANKEAVEFYTLAERHLVALGVEEWWETAVEIRCERGALFIILLDMQLALQDAQSALQFAKNHQNTNQLVRAYNLISEIFYRQAKYEETERITTIVIENFGKIALPDELARAYLWHGLASSTQAHYVEALESLLQAEYICLQNDNKTRLARVLEAMGLNYSLQNQLGLALDAMQRSVSLSRDFSKPVNLGIALNNIAFLQYKLGYVSKALETFNEVVSLGRELRHNPILLALALGNRGLAWSYIGRFKKTLTDFEEAVFLLTGMDYSGLLIETYLFWGYEYSIALGRWEEAGEMFINAERLIDLNPDNYPEERARLHLGLSIIMLAQENVEKADFHIRKAEKIVLDTNFDWWQPIISYVLALLAIKVQKYSEAKKQLDNGRQSIISGSGCPDYLPLIILGHAKIEYEVEKKTELFQDCIKAANHRARYIDKLYCFQVVNREFDQSNDIYLASLKRLEAKNPTVSVGFQELIDW